MVIFSNRDLLCLIHHHSAYVLVSIPRKLNQEAVTNMMAPKLSFPTDFAVAPAAAAVVEAAAKATALLRSLLYSQLACLYSQLGRK